MPTTKSLVSLRCCSISELNRPSLCSCCKELLPGFEFSFSCSSCSLLIPNLELKEYLGKGDAQRVKPWKRCTVFHNCVQWASAVERPFSLAAVTSFVQAHVSAAAIELLFLCRRSPNCTVRCVGACSYGGSTLKLVARRRGRCGMGWLWMRIGMLIL
jgi:hypothetical protein